jgi:hypothetical protein
VLEVMKTESIYYFHLLYGMNLCNSAKRIKKSVAKIEFVDFGLKICPLAKPTSGKLHLAVSSLFIKALISSDKAERFSATFSAPTITDELARFF